jgi:hypothetical protein
MRASWVGVLGAVALLMCAQNAVAGGRAIVQRTDPQAGSPAGVIYQIPLDTGRRDAAPVLPAGRRGTGSLGQGATPPGGPGGNSGGSGGSAAAGGASGAGASGTAGGESASSASPAGGGTPSDPSSIHSENGFGSASAVPGVSPAAVRIGAGVPAAHTASSTFPSYLLMVLIGAAAIAVGLVASRGRGSSR